LVLGDNLNLGTINIFDQCISYELICYILNLSETYNTLPPTLGAGVLSNEGWWVKLKPRFHTLDI